MSELIRYKNNKMSNEERNLFERAMERDPFLAEAMEGFSGFRTSDIEKDLASIDLISGKRKLKINPVVYYSVAATILVFVVSVFFVKNFGNKENVRSTAKVETNQTLVFSDSTFKASEKEAYSGNEDTSLLLLAQNVQDPTAFKEAGNNSKVVTTTAKLADKDLASAKKITDSSTTDKKSNLKASPVVTAMRAKKDSSPSEEQATPVQPEISAEPVIVDNEIKSEEPASKTSPEASVQDQNIRVGANAKPEPLGGFDLFKGYIDNNLTYPATETDGSREVVKVQFTVTKAGQLTNFSVDKAPENSDFTTEAIRLLKNGPKWAPAVKNGVPVDEVVNYRIVFKPESK